MAASVAKLGRVSWAFEHQNDTHTRGAASPRSASPMGPAPTLLPRIALPLLTDHPLLRITSCRAKFYFRPLAACGAPATYPESVVQQPAQGDDDHEPQDAEEDSDPVQITLYD